MTVTIPAEFVPERRYAVDVLLGEFLGLEYDVEVVAGARDYRLRIGARSLVVRDAFFGERREQDGYLDARYLPDRCARRPHPFVAGEDLVILFGSDELVLGENDLVCGIDLFAASFFMLTRWEEHVTGPRDQHGRLPAAASAAGRGQFLGRPVVNEYAELLWALLQRLGCAQRRRARELVISASHDVDWPYLWTAREIALTCAGSLKAGRPAAAARALRSFVATKARLRKDPYDTFDWLMDLSDECGVKSCFNFMTGGSTAHDPRHKLRGAALRRLLRHIDERGHEIGFHPSYDTYEDPARWEAEWKRLSEASPQPIKVGRQHLLRFDVPRTWRIWESRGMEWDSTLGYADHEGFRCGTCYDYPVFDVLARRPLRLREVPLVAMDATLVRYRKLSPAQAASSLEQLLAQVKKHRGQFVLLWHNSNLDDEWRPYREVYRRILRQA